MKGIILIIFQTIFVLVLYILGIGILGIALCPSLLLVKNVLAQIHDLNTTIGLLMLGLGLSATYFVFGITLMFVVGILRFLLQIKLQEGNHKIGSVETIKWYFVNALFLCVRTVFIEFMLLTPLCSLFYRLMGVKLGLNVQINSKNVADHSLLEIGDNTVIGGNATVVGHIFEPKGLRLMKVKIGRNVVIGLNSVIMPGVQIGDNSVVAAGAIVPKETVIPAYTIYYSPEKQVQRPKP